MVRGCFRQLPLAWYPCIRSAICRYATARCLTTRAQSQPLRVPPRCCASTGETGLPVASSEQRWPLPRVRPMRPAATQPRSRVHPMPRALALHPSEPKTSSQPAHKGGFRGPRKCARTSAWNHSSTVACLRASSAQAGSCCPPCCPPAACCAVPCSAPAAAVPSRCCPSCCAGWAAPLPAAVGAPAGGAMLHARACKCFNQRTPAAQWLTSSL